MQNSPARSSIDVGSVIAGTYTIEALIGRGGMGAVFLATHTRLPGKKVAIKVLHADLGGEEIEGRFKREAEIASLLSHPNICHIEDYNVTAEGMPYLVLEYLQGESLAQRLRSGPIDVDHTFRIIRQVGSALAAAHAKGIVHRDLKPQNIFLMPTELDGRTIEIAKVLDFGISKMRDSQTLKTQDNALLGTPQYMAPEQATGQHDKVDERTDIFALGAIVYEMLCGQPTFSGQTIPEVVFKVVYEQPIPLATRMPNLSDQVTSTVHKALSKQAEERYPSVTAFLEALTGSPISVIRNPPSLSAQTIDAKGPTSANNRRPNTDGDAFAKTMGSGDHGASPMVATAMAGTAAPLVSPLAVTIPSQDGRKAAPTAEALAAAEASATAPAPAAPPSRRTAALVGGVLAAAVAAAGIMYVVMRRDPSAPPTAGQLESQAPPPPSTDSPRVPPPVETKLLGAGSGSGEITAVTEPKVGPTPPTTTDPKPKVPPRVTPAPPITETGAHAGTDDAYVADKLRDAQAALKADKWLVAQEAATVAQTAEHASDWQRSQATMILGIAACNTNDEEGGQKAIRGLARRPAMRTRVITACHQHDFLMGISK